MVQSNTEQLLLLVLCTVAVTSARDQICSIDVSNRQTSTAMTESSPRSMVTCLQSTFESARIVGVDNAEVKSSSTAIAKVSVRANTTVSDDSTAGVDAVRASTGARTPSTLETRPPNPMTLTTSTFEAASIATHSQKKTLDDHALSSSTPNASASITDTLETNIEAADSGSHAEPDASLQIAFLVLGALLALASVVVAVFFGYKQLRFMRRQPGIGRNNNVHDNPSSGVDIEMAPATDRSGPARPSAQPSSTNQASTVTFGTGFAYFLDRLKSMCAAVSSPVSSHEGQRPLPNQDPSSVHESLSAPVETSQGHQEGDATLPTATQHI